MRPGHRAMIQDEVISNQTSDCQAFALDDDVIDLANPVIPRNYESPLQLHTHHSSLITHHSLPHSAFRTPHSAFRTPHSAFRTPHSALRIPHSSLITPHRKG